MASIGLASKGYLTRGLALMKELRISGLNISRGNLKHEALEKIIDVHGGCSSRDRICHGMRQRKLQ